MSNIFETIKSVDDLKASGMAEAQVKAILALMQKSQDSTTAGLATKQDITNLQQVTQQDIAELRYELKESEQATQQDIAKLQQTNQQDITELRHEISDL